VFVLACVHSLARAARWGAVPVLALCSLSPVVPAEAATRPAGGGAVVVVPASWTDPVSGKHYVLDPTGATDVSDGLNFWFVRGLTSGAIPAGSAGHPTTVRFPANARYRVEYGLTLGGSGSDRAHPGVPKHRVSHLVIDLNGGTLFQHDNTAFKGGKPPVQPRRRWGVQLLKLRFVDDVTVRNGTIAGNHATATDATFGARAAWHGIQINGGSGVTIRNMTIRNVWGDFVYLGRAVEQSTKTSAHNRNVLIDNVDMHVNGRQGVTVNDADGLVVRDSSITSVARFVIDSEPLPKAVVRDVTFTRNTWTGGGLGFFNMRAGRGVEVGDLALTDNTWIRGHLRVAIAGARTANGSVLVRHGLTITGNTGAATGKAARSTLVNVRGWTGVKVAGNTDYVRAKVKPLRLANSPGAVTSPNAFVAVNA
jgi:hypothetical protein